MREREAEPDPGRHGRNQMWFIRFLGGDFKVPDCIGSYGIIAMPWKSIPDTGHPSK